MKKATFGAGCFWGVELAFSQNFGVTQTAVGYAGGKSPDPTYEMVCTGQSGHAEVVEVEYDPSQIEYSALLELFWSIHDPTTLNRQGPDIGTQYRSVIFYHDAEQESAAKTSMEKLQRSGRFQGPIVTEIAAAPEFYRAEEYHQKYLEKRGMKNCH
jgi:peptide-methionine (S)-S-oxide reductase